MKKIFHILSLLLISIVTGYAQWVWQNPLPQGNSLNSVQYINDNLVWSGGIGGTLIKSIDGGNNWEVILLPEKLTVYDLFFINEQKGWATTGADNGTYKIFLTTNGGSSWAVQTDTIVSCRPIVFADEFRGWTGDWGNIWATTDGGENWFLQYDGSTNKFNSIFLIDDQHLIVSMEALRGGPLIKTANGGKDWIIDSTITWVQDVHFLDTLVGWAVGYSNIGKTTDGGATWQIQYNILDENWIDIYMHDSNRGWAVSTDGKIVSTTNGGISWTQQKNPAYSSLGSITFKNSSEGIITGFLGTILKTTNGGDEWIDMAKAVTKESLEGIYFLNENVGWIAGWNGLIIKTTDGGNNWELLFSGVNSSLGDIYFTNEMLGWATGTNGTIIHSTDGGQNWKPQKSPVNIYLSDIEFRYYPVGWIIGSEVFSDGRLLKTTDGGNTWKEANTIFPQGANTIQFTSEVRGWIMISNFTGGGVQRICRSTDSGDTWEIVLNTSFPDELMSMSFVSDSTGFVSTFDWKLYKTTDGANSWDVIQLPTLFSQISFLDEVNGWAGGAGGDIYYSNDGGITWFKQICPFRGVFSNLLMFDYNKGWAVASFGRIIHTSNKPTGIIDINPPDSKISEYKLFQNYPNPFNPITKIKFELPTSSRVTLIIYDVLGREVETLINEYKAAGNYEIEFNVSNYSLTSGVYFYQLSGEKFSFTKKMLIIK